MNEDLRRSYVRDLLRDLEQVGSNRFEQFIRPLWDRLAGEPVNARGLNREGAPVRGAVDAVWPDGSVAEASSEQDYFKPPFKKIRKDRRHIAQEQPQSRCGRFFSPREAEPSVAMALERYRQRARALGVDLDFWDGKRIAERIVDDLLNDDNFVQRVGSALPNLRRIVEQSAISQRLPPLDGAYAPRPTDQQSLIDQLNASKCVVLWGMGGVGKTETACAVAHTLQPRFEMVIWVDGERLQRVQELDDFDVRRNGYALNFRYLLRDRRVLLVLDNVRAELDTVALADACGEHSRVLITSQVRFGATQKELGLLDRVTARAVLEHGADTPCPEATFEEVFATVGGHALVLRILNRYRRERGQSWQDVAASCARASDLPDEQRRTVAERVLLRHLPVLRRDLQAFLWCRSQTVDRALLRMAITPIGIQNLNDWALVTRTQSDSVRLHDIAWACAERLLGGLNTEDEYFASKLEEILATSVAPKSLDFFRITNRHPEVIERCLGARPRPGALRFAYAHFRPVARLQPNLLGDPTADSQALPAFEGRAVAILSVMEVIEADFRRVRTVGNRDEARASLEARLPVFDTLTAATNDPLTLSSIRHHRAKALQRVGRGEEARREFEAMCADQTANAATWLQLARLLTNDPTRARDLIFRIIETEQAAPGAVSMSTLLETIGTMKRSHLSGFVPEMTRRFGPFLAQQIKAAACSGEDQPFRALAGVAEWAYEMPDLFVEIFEAISLPPASDVDDDDERLASARVLVALAKLLARRQSPDVARRRLQAQEFFDRIERPTGFSDTHCAENLLQLGRVDDARRVLERVAQNKREKFWLHRRSEVHLAQDEVADALTTIDAALAALPANEPSRYRATFLKQRAGVLRQMNDPAHLDVLRTAIATADSDQYRQELTEVLARWAAQTGT